jgi:hypothetical protein
LLFQPPLEIGGEQIASPIIPFKPAALAFAGRESDPVEFQRHFLAPFRPGIARSRNRRRAGRQLKQPEWQN